MSIQKDSNDQRNYFIDVLKGLTIFLVIFGHSIQYYEANHSLNFFSNNVFKFIYSFHMPMFALLSGYLFYFTIRKYDSAKLLIRKIKQLIIPLISWSMIGFIFIIINLKGITQINIYINNLLNLIFIGYWFIWVLLLCYITVLIVSKVFKNKMYVYLLIILISFLIPDGRFFYYYKFIFPYFLLGYCYNQYKLNLFTKAKLFTFLGISIIYGIMLYFFKDNYYIYITKMNIDSSDYIYQLYIILYRYIIGILGIAFISIIIKKIISFTRKYNDLIIKIMAYIGKYTLGLYLFSSLLFLYVFKYLIFFDVNSFLMYIYLTALSILITLFCLFVFKIIKLNKVTNKLFLGD